jgi:hypothetical protein
MTGRLPALDRTLALLPAHLRTRDEAAGGALRALLAAVAGELAVLETDLESLYDGWFIETCAEWLVPYLADLVGLAELPPELGGGVGAAPATRRALVANTVAYRRRKGTVAVLEQVTRDVTSWPAVAVEFYRLLSATTHLNHLRPDRPATASLRGAGRVELTASELAAGGLDTLPHTTEVRRIASGRGRFAIPHIGVFVFATQVHQVGTEPPGGVGALAAGWSQARPSGAGYTVDPLGRSVPLFAVPGGEFTIEQRAAEENLPVPLRPRRLMALLAAVRGGEIEPDRLPIGVWVGTESAPVPPDLMRVCGLEDLVPGAPDVQVMIDAVGGRLRVYRNGAPAQPARVYVRYAYGTSGAVGAGTYERSAVHERGLAADPFAGSAAVDGYIGVRSGAAASPEEVATVADALDLAEQVWAEPAPDDGRGSYVVAVADSASYPGHPDPAADLRVTVAEAARLVVLAAVPAGAAPPAGTAMVPLPYVVDGVRPHLRGNLLITAGSGSSVVLDGLIIEGDVVVRPGDLGSLTLSQCTLAGRVLVEGSAGGANGALQLTLVRSELIGVGLAETVPVVTLTDCVVDAPMPAGLPRTRARRAAAGSAAAGSGAAARAAVNGEGAHLALEGCTIRGGIRVRSMDASNCVLDGPVRVEHRQVGCVRYSYVAPGSRTARRFRCVPADDSPRAAAPVPVYTSDQPGAPGYLALAAGCPAELAAGGEFEAEMGVHHHLRRPVRLRAALRQAQPYLPVGLEIGMFGS